MGTRSIIGQAQADGTVKAVYCQFDGYIEGVGQTLVDWIAGKPQERRAAVITTLLGQALGWSSLVGCDIDLPARPVGTGDSHAPEFYPDGDPLSGTFADARSALAAFGTDYGYIFDAELQHLAVYQWSIQRGVVRLDAPFDLITTI